MKQSRDIETMYKVMFPDFPDVVSVAQLQKMLGISRHFAYSMINDGTLQAIRIGSAYRVPKVYVIDYILTNCVRINNISEDEEASTEQGCPNMTRKSQVVT